MKEKLVLDGNSLTLNQIINFIENKDLQVQISEDARKCVQHTRNHLEKWISEGQKVIYGVTTGLGKLKDYVVSEENQIVFQRNILYSHAVGIGSYFDNNIVRLAMLLRVNVLCRGNSGVRIDLLDRILVFLNKGIIPQLPQIGSLGVGDLQPMANLGMCIAGYPEGNAWYSGKVDRITNILKELDICPVEFALAAREALALMSGSTVLLAASIYVYYKADKLTKIADLAASLTLEAVRGEKNAFDIRIHRSKGFATQISVAENINRLIKNSEWMSDEGRKRAGENSKRVQDAVSLRSTPQIHGSVRDVLEYIKTVLEREINVSTDNPLLFKNNDTYESVSGGNFHGSMLSYSMDFLGIVLTDLAVLSERRSARLLDPVMSYGLPANLVGDSAGLNTGFALIQANAAAIVGEMRILATPASIGSIPSKGNQEDHNSMGMGAVRKALKMIDLLKIVLSIELLCGAQAIDLISDSMKGLKLGKGTEKIHFFLRKASKPMRQDRYIISDLNNIIELLENGTLMNCMKEYVE